MADYQLSARAAAVLEDIFVYTVHKHGQAQAEAYHEGFHRIFGLLADFPLLGQTADEYLIGLHKFRHLQHKIFYTVDVDTVTIQYVLHYRQDDRQSCSVLLC